MKYKPEQQQAIIERAIYIIRENASKYEIGFTNPDDVVRFCQLRIANEEREHFLVLYLNNQHQLIKDEILFSGTINSAEVHPRIIAKRALELNANAVILSHNHPSGFVDPSPSDRHITDKIEQVLNLLSIRTLDHVIVSNHASYSFASHGLI